MIPLRILPAQVLEESAHVVVCKKAFDATIGVDFDTGRVVHRRQCLSIHSRGRAPIVLKERLDRLASHDLLEVSLIERGHHLNPVLL